MILPIWSCWLSFIWSLLWKLSFKYIIPKKLSLILIKFAMITWKNIKRTLQFWTQWPYKWHRGVLIVVCCNWMLSIDIWSRDNSKSRKLKSILKPHRDKDKLLHKIMIVVLQVRFQLLIQNKKMKRKTRNHKLKKQRYKMMKKSMIETLQMSYTIQVFRVKKVTNLGVRVTSHRWVIN